MPLYPELPSEEIKRTQALVKEFMTSVKDRDRTTIQSALSAYNKVCESMPRDPNDCNLYHRRITSSVILINKVFFEFLRAKFPKTPDKTKSDKTKSDKTKSDKTKSDKASFEVVCRAIENINSAFTLCRDPKVSRVADLAELIEEKDLYNILSLLKKEDVQSQSNYEDIDWLLFNLRRIGVSKIPAPLLEELKNRIINDSDYLAQKAKEKKALNAFEVDSNLSRIIQLISFADENNFQDEPIRTAVNQSFRSCSNFIDRAIKEGFEVSEPFLQRFLTLSLFVRANYNKDISANPSVAYAAEICNTTFNNTVSALQIDALMALSSEISKGSCKGWNREEQKFEEKPHKGKVREISFTNPKTGEVVTLEIEGSCNFFVADIVCKYRSKPDSDPELLRAVEVDGPSHFFSYTEDEKGKKIFTPTSATKLRDSLRLGNVPSVSISCPKGLLETDDLNRIAGQLSGEIAKAQITESKVKPASEGAEAASATPIQEPEPELASKTTEAASATPKKKTPYEVFQNILSRLLKNPQSRFYSDRLLAVFSSLDKDSIERAKTDIARTVKGIGNNTVNNGSLRMAMDVICIDYKIAEKPKWWREEKEDPKQQKIRLLERYRDQEDSSVFKGKGVEIPSVSEVGPEYSDLIHRALRVMIMRGKYELVKGHPDLMAGVINRNNLETVMLLVEKMKYPNIEDFLNKRAASGDFYAQFKLGYILAGGYNYFSMKENEKLAVEYLDLVLESKSASDEYKASAAYTLAILYREGAVGVEKNEAKAIELLRLAVKKGGTAESQFILAETLYESVIGNVTKNKKEAVGLFRLAADQGLREAQHALGLHHKGLYDDNLKAGVDGSENKKQAVHFFKLAANQGNKEAQYQLGLHHKGLYDDNLEAGHNEPKNTENKTEALRYFNLAAEQGYKPAQDMVRLWVGEAEFADQFAKIAKEKGSTLEAFRVMSGGNHVAMRLFEEVLFHRQQSTTNVASRTSANQASAAADQSEESAKAKDQSKTPKGGGRQ